MNNESYGRGLYVFAGLPADLKSPTSDPTASTWATPPLPGQRAFESSVGEYRFNDERWNQISSILSGGGEGGLVAIGDVGVISQSRNRIRTALNETYARATNGCSWSSATNIREISVLVTATGAVDSETYVDLAINAGTEAIAGAWLTEVDSASDDAQIERIKIGERVTLRFTAPLTNLDVLPVSMSATLTNIKMFVGAH